MQSLYLSLLLIRAGMNDSYRKHSATIYHFVSLNFIEPLETTWFCNAISNENADFHLMTHLGNGIVSILFEMVTGTVWKA